MEEKKKKGFFSSLFVPKSKGCCCNVQFEEVPQEDHTEETLVKTEEKAPSEESAVNKSGYSGHNNH